MRTKQAQSGLQIQPEQGQQSHQLFQVQQTSGTHQNYSSIPMNSSLNYLPKHALPYRPDIDGLRTIAVTLVIIYHAFPQFIPGGFIGVDVFFVISGYLISQILLNQLRNQQFSFKQFYVRRTKRIMPALLAVLGFTLYVTWKFSENQQSILTLNTLKASLIFGANIQILAHEKGYWDIEVRKNPLLHLWSLGVEEQFYIVWPVLLLVVFKFCKNKISLVLSICTALSFIFSIFSVYSNPKFAFYFPLCRFWQMAIGGIIAHINITLKNPLITNIFSFLALTAILVTSFYIDQNSLFPGYFALIPTLGAALIIQVQNRSFVNHYILSSRPFVFIGKISYSLYLWHWPLLVFSRTFYPEGSTSIFSNTYFILFLTVTFSLASYYMVENPIRKKTSNKIVITLLIALMLVAGIFAVKMPMKQNQVVKTIDSFTEESQKLNESKEVQYFKRVDMQMMPRDEDYVIKDGKRHPNLSKSKNRIQSTVETIKAAFLDWKYDMSHTGEVILQKDIDQTSKFYYKQKPYIKHYSVANEGKQKLLLMVGDSHMTRLTYRFQQLYRQSLANGTIDNFPTLVDISTAGMKLDRQNKQSSNRLDFVIQFTKKYKPQRVLISCHWIRYWCGRSLGKPITAKGQCNLEVANKSITEMMEFVNKLQELGSEVSVITIDLDGPQLDPQHMTTISQVIEKNVQPFKLSDFRRKHQGVIDIYEEALRKNNVGIIDLSENMCYQDTCHVISPKGYAIYTDSGHYGKFYAHHWLSVVDDLVQI